MLYDKVSIYPYLSLNNGGVRTYSETDRYRPIIGQGTQPPTSDRGLVRAQPIAEFSDITPRKGNELRCIEVPMDIRTQDPMLAADFDAAARYMTLHTSQGRTIYAWIDRLEPVAVQGPQKNTRIYFHVDYWMQFLHDRTQSYRLFISGGRMLRGPAESARPDPAQPLLWLYDTRYDLESSPNRLWQILLVQTNTGSWTQSEIWFWPLDYTGTSYNFVDMDHIYSGQTEEYLGLQPSQIVGAWISPIAPAVPDPNRMHRHTTPSSETWSVYYRFAGNVADPDIRNTVTMNLGAVLKTTDTKKYVISDPNGTVLWTAPWGVKFRYAMLNCDIGSLGAYMNVRLSMTSGGAASDNLQGMSVQIPLIEVPITSNAMSDYVYSGQRTYDMSMAQIQRDAQLANGIAGIGNSAIGGAMMGGMQKPGSPAAGGAGQVAGVVQGTASQIAGFIIQGDVDSKSQMATDRLMSNQISTVLINSGGLDWYANTFTQHKWSLVALKADEVSAGSVEEEQHRLGYVTNVYLDDPCQYIITAGGGQFAFEQVEIQGPFPAAGYHYVQSLFKKNIYWIPITM